MTSLHIATLENGNADHPAVNPLAIWTDLEGAYWRALVASQEDAAALAEACGADLVACDEWDEEPFGDGSIGAVEVVAPGVLRVAHPEFVRWLPPGWRLEGDTTAALIAESVEQNSIVHAEYTDELVTALQVACDDYVETDEVVEFWGTADDGDEWRVHLDRPAGADSVTNDDIRQLRAEAAQAGDEAQVALCDCALEDETTLAGFEARERCGGLTACEAADACVAVIVSARAVAD